MEQVRELISNLLRSLEERLIERCGDDFVSLVVFGSFARQDFSLDSDIDLLLISRRFPGHSGDNPRAEHGSPLRARTQLFLEIEAGIEQQKLGIWETTGYYPHFSPILRTVEEAKRFSRIYLDMTEHVLVVYDRDEFFAHVLQQVRRFVGMIDAQKRWIGNKWYWVFAPETEVGELLPDG